MIVPDPTTAAARRNWRRRTPFNNKRGAEKELALIVSDIVRKPGLTRLKRITFGAFCKEYLEFSEANHRSWKAVKSRLKHLKGFFGENTWVQDISARKIERYKILRLNERKWSTVNKEIALLKSMFTTAIEWGYLYENEAKKVKLLKGDNQRVRYLETKAEMDALVAQATPSIRPIIQTALNTGLRRGELFQLQWRDIDLRNRLINVVNSKSGKSRGVPINKTLLTVLQSLPRRIDSVYVFPGKNGGPLTDIKKSFATALRKAGIEDFTFHDLRHSFASHLVMNGIGLETVADLLGHSKKTGLQMTRRYAHLSPRHTAGAVEVLDNLRTDERAEAIDSR